MKITIKFFARLREVVGTKTLEREVPAGAAIADLTRQLQAEFPRLTPLLEHTAIALNQEFVDPQTRLADGDEVAFFPPVSGGAGDGGEESGLKSGLHPPAESGLKSGHRPPAESGFQSGHHDAAKFAITFDPLSIDEIAAGVVKPETGAVAVFVGTVRNVSNGKAVSYLEYEAYEEMAVAKLRQVAAEARQKWPHIVDMAIIQRIGRLEVGENAVVIAVSSAHRDDGCFEACVYAINRLKEIAPIWKKEVGPDGLAWIEGDYLPSAADAAYD